MNWAEFREPSGSEAAKETTVIGSAEQVGEERGRRFQVPFADADF